VVAWRDPADSDAAVVGAVDADDGRRLGWDGAEWAWWGVVNGCDSRPGFLFRSYRHSVVTSGGR